MEVHDPMTRDQRFGLAAMLYMVWIGRPDTMNALYYVQMFIILLGLSFLTRGK